MGETETPHFHDFGTFEGVPDSPNQLFFIFGDTKIPETIEKVPNTFSRNIMCITLKVWASTILFFLESWAPPNDEYPSNKILKILEVRSISIEEHEMEIW